MRKSIRYTGIAVLSATMLVAGTASARDHYHRGGGGSSAGAAIAVAAVAGLALGALVASQPVVAAPAPVYAPPQPVSYAAPAVPPGYCYDEYRGAYVPCGRPAPVRYYAPQPQPYYGY